MSDQPGCPCSICEQDYVHNHGTEEGNGLACQESVVGGKLKGECMNQSDSRDSAGQSADLRTRIAAVVADHHQRWGMRCECGADHAHADGLADAVIAELGLRQEWGALDHENSGFLSDTREELTVGNSETVKYRYVTDWESHG